MMAILLGRTTASRWKSRISISVELPGAQFPDGPYAFIGDDVKSGFKKDASVVSELKSENRLRSKAEQSLVTLKKLRGEVSICGFPTTL
jgi:hypothetical protein